MDNTLSHTNELVLQSAKASNEPNTKSRSSSKRRSKTRSKVWEKVAWFTRKTKSGRENRVESTEEGRKVDKSHALNVLRTEAEGDECRVEILPNAIGNNSPSLCKTKSGIRKTKSFNYLKKKKLKHYAIENNSTLSEEAIKENGDPTSTCQTATGNFHDFASVGRRSSSILALGLSNNLVTEMAREMNFKQKEKLKDSTSLLSLNERPANICSHSCRGLVCTCKSNTTKSLSCPKYNSWPRKKRLLVTNQSYEAFSSPQKQKKIYGLRKTATFSGFESSKLSNKETKEKELRGVKSTPLLSGQNQIKNQNGLDIGIIHFFKSSRNEDSNYNFAVTRENCVLGPVLQNVKKIDSTTEQTSDANIENNIVNPHSDLESEISDSAEMFLSSSQSNFQSNHIFAEIEQHDGQNSDNIENISKDLAECTNIGAIVSMKECFVVEDPVNEVCRLTFDDTGTSWHQKNINQINASKQDIEETCEYFCASLDEESSRTTSSSEAASHPDLALHSFQQLCPTDKQATCENKHELLRQLEDNLAQVNNYNIESSEECNEHNIVRKENNKTDICSLRKPVETGIFCIKIEDQVADFSKEVKLDFQTPTKLQPSNIISDPFVEKVLKDNTYIKENPLIQSANNSKASGLLCAVTNDSTVEEKHEKVVPERIMFNDSVLLSNVITLEGEGTVRCYNDEDVLQKVKSTEKSEDSHTNPLSTSEENQSNLKSAIHLLKRSKPKVDGLHFKHQTETILDWFSVFNDEQKNILIKKILEQCELPQMHLLSVVMKPVLHESCPPNCQDMLAWLPNPVTNTVLSYLDPESLCRCSKVNKYWNSLASNPLNWKILCKSSEWQLSRKTEEKQLVIYSQLCGTVQWKTMFAERYLLRKNWLNGRCKVRTFEGHTQGISCVQFDDTRIVSGSTDKTIKVWDLSRDDSHAVLTLAGHSGTVRCLNLNGNRLVSGSVDRSIKVWDLSFESYWSGASCKVTMIGHVHTVRCLQVDDDKVVSGSYDKTLKVWDLKTGQCKLTLRGHNAAVLCVQFDENKIVSGSYDNTIKVWGLDEGECLMTLAGHHDAVTCLNLTQNGRKVISGSLDHNLKFWDLATGKCIGTLDWIRSEGHTGVIRCLQSDSWRIVSAGDDKTLKMWSLETGQRLLTLRCHTDGVTCLQFNDYRIVSGSYDKTVKVWNFSPEHEFLNPS